MPTVAIGKSLLGPGQKKYTITDFLGKGAFGEVYRAVGHDQGDIIAVKVLPTSEIDESSRFALLNEMSAATKINHPNVVRVLYADDAGFPDVGPYLCMEYVPDGTLSRVLKAQSQAGASIPLATCIGMMLDIAQGTRAVNEVLIHRDIKPDNILVDGNRLKIGDFGISKFVDQTTRSHTFKGGQHIAYMAPEGWELKDNTYKIDVYSVGLVFYQLLLLKHPLADKVQDPGNWRQWERAHLYELCGDVRKQRPEASSGLAQLLTRMVAKRPQERPTWDEVLQVLSEPTNESSPSHPSISAAVQASVAKHQQDDTRRLEDERRRNESQRLLQNYAFSCDQLIAKFEPLVDQFNTEFQFGKIKVQRDAAGVRLQGVSYSFPGGKQIRVDFFGPRESGMKLRSGYLIGGGWISVLEGRGANLLLLREADDDLYGRWVVCEIDIMAMADARKLIGRFGLTKTTVTPFGFRSSDDFYDQIGYAQRGLHVFTYNFLEDCVDYFALLIEKACQK